MAGKTIPVKSATITAATAAGYITVASTTGFYKKAKVWLSAAGQPSVFCEITEVASATSLGIRIIPAQGLGPSYGRSDVSLYNGGTINQEDQFVYNTDDLPLA